MSKNKQKDQLRGKALTVGNPPPSGVDEVDGEETAAEEVVEVELTKAETIEKIKQTLESSTINKRKRMNLTQRLKDLEDGTDEEGTAANGEGEVGDQD